MATAYPGGLRKRGGLLDEFMAPDYSYLARRAELTPKQREYAANAPIDFLRGTFAGLLGTPADVANIPQSPMPMEQFGEYSYAPAQKIPYGSEYFLKNLPLAPAEDNPLGRVAGQVGSFAPMVPVQAARMAGKGVAATGRFVAPKAGLLAEEYMQGIGAMPGILPQPGRSGMGAFDPRYDPRVNEKARMQAMTRDIQLNPNAANAPTVSLANFEGRPFITSMADRTAAGGSLVGINDVAFNRPVGLLGGQDYMFNNPGQVWASAQGPVTKLMEQADEIKTATGQNPLYLPWRMAPTGGDFASMTGETMLAYADSAMGKMQKRRLDKAIKEYIPDWSGVSNPASVDQFRNASDKKRKAIKDVMDKNFRDQGGLNIGSARLAVSDPAQLAAQEGGVQNVGEIFAKNPMVMQSGHPSYPRGVPGQGLGILAEDINIFELLPEVVRARGIANPATPGQTDLRALQMKPYAGVITEDLLKRLGY
jgi:hypothetical protein